MSLVRFSAQNHPQQKTKPEIDDRATTPEMFAALHERFRFTVDVAAEEHNAKLPRFYGPDENGLEQSWSNERVFCNPPYSDIRPWVEKALRERRWASLIVMLLPANRTEQAWWQELVEPNRDRRAWASLALKVEFMPGRIRFIRSGSIEVGPNERPPFGSCLLIWSNEPQREAVP